MAITRPESTIRSEHKILQKNQAQRPTSAIMLAG